MIRWTMLERTIHATIACAVAVSALSLAISG
jgi:cytochrome b subunit of formate dehydrogenase